jgi:DNA-binding MarR family transcriptional regulator
MAKQPMGYLVQELVDAGYLKRLADPADGRAKIIERTERGWAFQRLAGEVVAQVEEEWDGLIGTADLAQLKDLLNRLCVALGYRYEGSVAEAARRSAGRPAGSSY